MTEPYQPDPDHIAYLRDNVSQHWEAGAQLTPEDGEELIAEINKLVDALTAAEQRVAELEAELEPEPKVEDTVQLVIPRGPMLDGLKNILGRLGCVMAGPLPLEREPIPTYVLQPLNIEPTDGSDQ